MSTISPFRKSFSASTLLFVVLSLTGLYVQAQNSSNELSELPSGTYSVDLSHASVVWKVNHLGLSGYVGRFADFSADLELNTADLSKSSVNVVILTGSVSTEYPSPEQVDFDKKIAMDVLKGKDFPEITFNSTSVSALAKEGKGDSFSILGDLTMGGQTHPVTLDATLNGAMLERPFSKKPIVGFSATTSFNRSEWGLGIYVPTVGDEMTVGIEGEFILKDR